MKITLAQLNPTVGDISGNLEKVKNVWKECEKESSDLLVMSELFLLGYPPRDLLERPRFIEKTQAAIAELTKLSKNHPQTGLLLGAPIPTGKDTGKGLYNSALLIYQGRILFRQHKSLLPTYDVFDEARYFDPADKVEVVGFKDQRLGISICEDAWNDPRFWARQFYSFDPLEKLAQQGASLFINISASPFHMGKEKLRYQLIKNHAQKHKIPFVFVNQVGGNDELVFDGRSLFVDREGGLAKSFPPFREQVETLDIDPKGGSKKYKPLEEIESIHQALTLGVCDYMKKCGFSKAVVGLSGGIDSAVTCCVAAEAIGNENVLGVSMPSPYSSKGSLEDSRKLADNLGIEFKVVNISSIYDSYSQTLKGHLDIGDGVNVALENVQARIRGNILMAISNQYSHLVLSTGNKSELAVGYCTLYGDMTGGLAVLSDVPKTYVYKLAESINKEKEVIPREIIEKPPSAELKPDQKDQDTLPPYQVLDEIIHYYVDEGYSLDEILNQGLEPEVVKRVIRDIDRNEYKRRQAAPGLKVTTKAFGMGRRMPIAAKYEI